MAAVLSPPTKDQPLFRYDYFLLPSNINMLGIKAGA